MLCKAWWCLQCAIALFIGAFAHAHYPVIQLYLHDLWWACSAFDGGYGALAGMPGKFVDGVTGVLVMLGPLVWVALRVVVVVGCLSVIKWLLWYWFSSVPTQALETQSYAAVHAPVEMDRECDELAIQLARDQVRPPLLGVVANRTPWRVHWANWLRANFDTTRPYDTAQTAVLRAALQREWRDRHVRVADVVRDLDVVVELALLPMPSTVEAGLVPYTRAAVAQAAEHRYRPRAMRWLKELATLMFRGPREGAHALRRV